MNHPSVLAAYACCFAVCLSFADGLFASKIFVPVLSKAGLAKFAGLTVEGHDNVLLEHVLALELKQRGRVKAIYPVFVGEPCQGTSKLSNFFATCKWSDYPKDVLVASVDEKARGHLTRKLGPDKCKLDITDRSPRGVLEQLSKHQGGFVFGECDKALDEISATILQMVRQVAVGKTIAEADSQPASPTAHSPSSRSPRPWRPPAWLPPALPSPIARSPSTRGGQRRWLDSLMRRRALPDEILLTERGVSQGHSPGAKLAGPSSERERREMEDAWLRSVVRRATKVGEDV